MSDAARLQKLVQTAMDAILVRHDRAEVRQYFHPDFVQHNPWAADGGAHVEEMCDFTFGVRMSRWAIQGDLVAYHGLYTAPNPLGDDPLLCVDIWRVQGDQIVEHWDALQPTPVGVAEVMLAGGGDGFAAVSPAQVAANVATARTLLEVGVRDQDVEVIDRILAADFAVRRPGVLDGRAGFIGWVQKAAPQIEVKRTVASGELVFVQLLVTIGAHQQVVYDIFRFDRAGRIAEQWMVAQDRVPLVEAANPHPHF